MKKLDSILKKKSWTSHIEIHDFFNEKISEIFNSFFTSNKKKTIDEIILFRNILIQHMHFEDTYVYPLFKKYVNSFISYAKPEYFDDDHKKLNAYFTQLIYCIFFSSKKEIVFEFYKLIDLLEHHDKRESTGLYPLLEKEISSQDKENLLNLFESHIETSCSEIDITGMLQLTSKWNHLTFEFVNNNIDIEIVKTFKADVQFLHGQDPIFKKFIGKLDELVLTKNKLDCVKMLKQAESLLKAYLKFTLGL